MKKIFTLIFAGILTNSLFAQNYEIRRDTIVEQNTDKHKVITNKFGGNWFIGAGVGQQIFLGNLQSEMDFGDRLEMAYGAYFGKWFTPSLGVRAGINGYRFQGVTKSGIYGDGSLYDASKGLYSQEVDFYQFHGDVLLNLTQLFGGYKEDRFYEISPYVGLGWIVTSGSPVEREVTGNIGLFNSFRLGKSWALTLDLRNSFVNDKFNGEVIPNEKKNESLASGTVGLRYSFGKKKWDQSVTKIIQYNESDLQRLRDAVNKLANDNNQLKKQLAEAKGKTITEIKVEKSILAAPILVTFPINKSTLSNEARVNLGFFAKIIKEASSNIKYDITGYADKGTGTASTNDRLSRERAEAIYNVLVREFGVSPAQLNVQFKGGVDNMYYDDPRLSRAVIVIGN